MARLPQYPLSYTGLFSAKEKGKLSKDLHPRVQYFDHIHGVNPEGIVGEYRFIKE